MVAEKTNPKEVNVQLGFTLNTGNFQNVRIDVGATDHVHNGETVDEAIDRLYETLGAQLVAKVAQTKADLGV